MMQPGQKKVLQQPLQPSMRTAFGQGQGMDWADGAVQTMFGQGGASAGQTLFGTGGAANKEVPSLAILATDVLLIGVKIRETPNLGQADQLKRLLTSYIKDFERTCLSHGKPAESVEQAKYALAAFIDETVINSENNCRETWIADHPGHLVLQRQPGGREFLQAPGSVAARSQAQPGSGGGLLLLPGPGVPGTLPPVRPGSAAQRGAQSAQARGKPQGRPCQGRLPRRLRASRRQGPGSQRTALW